MTAERALDFYFWLKELGIAIWIDGGWCVDALLGRQTREHEDLDIAVHYKDSTKLRQLLENQGYAEQERDDSSIFMYVMKNEDQEVVDVHVFAYDESGKSSYGVPYPLGSLTAEGTIGGHKVNCVSPFFIFQFKTGYEPRDKDLQDVRALSEAFGFELPARYAMQAADLS